MQDRGNVMPHYTTECTKPKTRDPKKTLASVNAVSAQRGRQKATSNVTTEGFLSNDNDVSVEEKRGVQSSCFTPQKALCHSPPSSTGPQQVWFTILLFLVSVSLCKCME